MRRLRHQLARLHAAELRERAVRRLVAPDALRGRQQRIAAVAVLVVAVVLIAVDDDLVADLPAPHLRADAQTMPDASEPAMWNGFLCTSSGEIGMPKPGPDAVVVDAAGHHEDQHLVLADRPGRQHLDLHRGFGRAMALLADRPGVHLRRHVAERRDFADLVEVLERRRLRRLRYRNGRHGVPPRSMPTRSCCQSAAFDAASDNDGVSR